MFFTLEWLLLLDERRAIYVFNVCGRLRRVGRADWRVVHTDTHKKGPMHIWIPETAQEHWAAEKELENLNAIWEPKLRLQ